MTKAFDNLELVLKQAGLGFANVVRLNYYTTDERQMTTVPAEGGA